MMKRKSEAFIIVMTSLGTNKITVNLYAGSNRNKTKWRHRDHEGAFAVELSFNQTNQTTTIGLRYSQSRWPDQTDKTEFYFFQECAGSWRCKATSP